MAYFPDVSMYSNGDRLDADTMNKPLGQLEARTAWLKDRLDTVVGVRDFSSVRLPDVEFGASSDGTMPEQNDVVFLDRQSNIFKKALAGVVIESNPYEIGDGLSYAVGIVAQSHSNASSSTGTVVLYGLAVFGKADDGESARRAIVQKMVEDGETYRNGPYYLSSVQPGRLTSNPKGPAVYVGMFNHGEHYTYALIAPQFKDMAEMHRHRAFVLSNKAQGTVDASDVGHVKILGVPSTDGRNAYLSVSGSYTGTTKFRYTIGVRIGAGRAVDGLERGTKYVEWTDCYTGGYCISEWQNGPFAIGDAGVIGQFSREPTAGGEWTIESDTLGRWVQSDRDGFAYKYEVGLDPDLNKHFPPTPISGAVIVMNGIEMTSAELFGPGSDYMLTGTAIYWRPSTAYKAPFSVEGLSIVHSSILYLTRGQLHSSSFVTSIKAAEGSGLHIRSEGTPNVANTGNLVIEGKIPIVKVDPGLNGYNVPKDVVNNKLIFGPVVSSITSADPNIVIHSRKGQPTGRGDVLLASGNMLSGRFDDIVLHNAKQELIGSFPYIKLLGEGGVSSGFTLKMHVPFSVYPVDGGYSLLFYMSVFGLSDVNDTNNAEGFARAAGIGVRADVLQDWYPGLSDANMYLGTLKDNVKTVAGEHEIYPVYFGGASKISYKDNRLLYYEAFDPILVHNDIDLNLADDAPDADNKAWKQCMLPISIPGDGILDNGLTPNSTIAITVTREASPVTNAPYEGEIGFVNMAWKLVQSSLESE